MPPILDPAEEQHITWAFPDAQQRWPLGPLRWIPGKDGTLVALAVGSKGGKDRREVVATLHPDGKADFAQTQASAAMNEGMEKLLPTQSKEEREDLTNGHT